MHQVSLIIGADICPTKNNSHLFESGDVKSLVGTEILDILQKADLRIFNLECPLANEDTPILKSGPHLRARSQAINGIKALNPNLLSLANNHVYDHGEQGLSSTIEILKQNDIPFIGVNSNEIILDKNGIRIGIYACAEHEFNIESSYFDPLETPDRIFALKQKSDYVVVLYHGGKEHYRYPSPLLQKRFRKMAEKGANLVIAQHTHCVGCYEIHQGSALVYGQGNFIFEGQRDEFWDSCLLIRINATKNTFSVEYIPISKNADEKQVLADFEKRTLQIQETDFVEKEYGKFAEKKQDFYLDSLQANYYFYRLFTKFFGINISKRLYSKKRLLRLQNIIQCEAHRELLLRSFVNKNVVKEV